MKWAGMLEQVKLGVYVAVFLIVHLVTDFIDRVIIRALRALCRESTRRTGFPPQWVFHSARPLTRRSQTHRAAVFHMQSAANAHQWFGWPIVTPRSQSDENPLGTASEAPDHVLSIRSPQYTNHVSTIFANFKPVPRVAYHREIVQSYDGCDLAVDWAYPEENLHLFAGPVFDATRALAGVARAMGQIDETFTRFGIPPQHVEFADAASAKANCIGVLSIVPGLTSESTTTYIASFVRVALSHGFAVCVVHTRGIATRLTRPKIWHGGFTEDVRHWTYTSLTREAIAKRFGRPLNACLVGFSLGGNVLNRFLAEEGDRVQRESAVVCASAACVPWHFMDVKEPMDRLIQRMTYDMDFRTSLVQYLRYNEAALRDPITGAGAGFDFDRALKITATKEFDEHVIIKHHGWDTRDDYYRAVSSFPVLHKVTLPLVCVANADDPVCGPPPSETKWRDLCARTPSVVYAELPWGGHLGCLGTPFAEMAMLPNPVEELVCRSMAHFLVHRSQGTELTNPHHSDE